MEKLVQKKLILEGLDCANCANKIEAKVNKLNGVSFASIDFVNKLLSIELDSSNSEKIISDVGKIILDLEPYVIIKEKDSSNKNSFEFPKNKIICISIGVILFLIGIIFKLPIWIDFTIFMVSYILIGHKVLIKASKNLFKGRIFDENFLMGISTIGAFALKEFPEAVAVMLFYEVGELFQLFAVNRSRKSISALMDIRPDYANLIIGKDNKKVNPDKIDIGDKILVKPGEKIPLDGIILEGSSTLDTGPLTGESIPQDVEKGSNVLSGSINLTGLITIEVIKKFGDSTVSKILDLVQNASSNKSKTENFITKFAKYYTPFVFFASIAIAVIPPLFIENPNYDEWIYRGLIFLVVSCPCALVISIPLGFFGGIGGASQSGILVKSGNHLEALNNIDTIVFDKTGTLTKGSFEVVNIKSISDFTQNELLKFAAYGEVFSNHPIAFSIIKAYKKEINTNKIFNYTEIPGHGVKMIFEEKEILIGNDKLLKKENIEFNLVSQIGTTIYIAVDEVFIGYIVLSDVLKDDSYSTIQKLKDIGIRKIVMLTGDSNIVAKNISKKLGLHDVYGELLPQDKVSKFQELSKDKLKNGNILFVGDGINDAPVLAGADVGISMGGLGSDAAIDASDIVIMNDEPSKIITAIKIANSTRNIVWQNIFFSFLVKGIVLILGAGGLATMWEAVFADVGVAIIAIINSMRLITKFN